MADRDLAEPAQGGDAAAVVARDAPEDGIALSAAGAPASVLQRKARPGLRIARSRRGAPGPARALRLALARAAADEMDLPVALEDPDDLRVSLGELLDRSEDGALFLLLDGPGEALGLCMVCPVLLAGFIEWLTLRRVSPAPPLPRRPTRTDAALLAGFVDRLLDGFAGGLVDPDDRRWAGGFVHGTFLPDARPLGHVMEDVAYRTFVATIALAGGVKGGGLILALPAEPKLPARARAEAAGTGAAGQWAGAIERAVLAAPTRLDAVLARIRLPLSQVMALRPGAMLPLSMGMIARVGLEGPGGRRVAEGRLGQAGGNRALRLHLEMPAAESEGSRAKATAPPAGDAGPQATETGGGNAESGERPAGNRVFANLPSPVGAGETSSG